MEEREIYNALSEIKERTTSVETKIDILVDNNKKLDNVKDIAIDAKNSADSAHRRLDRIDKWVFAVGSAAVIAVISSVLSLILQ